MTHPNREIPRPTCHGEEEPAALAMARSTDPALLRQCIASGQVSAAQAVAHHEAGEVAPVTGSTWWQSLSPAERASAIRRAE